jgi:GR25 family glycosyltransferase involved in LPS biosynthesis
LLTVRPAPGRAKLGVAFLADDAERLKRQVETFLALRRPDVEWCLVFVHDATRPELAAGVAAVAADHEIHLVDSGGDATRAMAEIARLHAACGCDATMTLGPQADLAAGPLAARLEPLGHVGAHEAFLARAAGGAAMHGLIARAGATGAFDAAARGGDGPAPLGVVLAQAGAPEPPFAALAVEPPAPAPPRWRAARRFDDFFERRLVLNLDRRPDRWEQMSAQMASVGITAERFSAVDGSRPEIREEYAAYAGLPLVAVSDDIPPVRYSVDLYMNYASQMARLAHLEGKSGRKAIASAGAWGYLRSYEAILEKALEDRVETLFVFDDDSVLHKDFEAIFAQAAQELPDDWMAFQLGTLQYNWHPPFAQDHSAHLYRTNGSAVGSHAVGLRFDAFPYLLDQVRRMDMPFDVGALSALTRDFADRCFVIRPNLAIQRLQDSDINTSEFQSERSREEVAATHRWRLADYQL